MARPRKATDQDVFAAVHRVISRQGPAQVTLTEIAREAGVTPSALIQRFGSKRDLMLSFTALSAEAARHLFESLREANDSPLAAIRDYAECMAGMGASPEELAHHLAYLQIDIGDPDFRRHVGEQARVTDEALTTLVEEGVRAGEFIPGVDPSRLARTIQAIVGGALLAWGFRPVGAAAAWVLDDLDAVLRPHLAAGHSAAVAGHPFVPSRVPSPARDGEGVTPLSHESGSSEDMQAPEAAVPDSSVRQTGDPLHPPRAEEGPA